MIGDAGEALASRLLNATGTTPASTAVATLVGARVYSSKLPQGVQFPAISYSLSSEQRQSTFGGPTALPGQLYTIDCWGGETYTAARTLAKAVRLALDGIKDWSSTGTVTIQVSIVEQQHDIYEDDVNVHRVSMDVRLWPNEAQS